MILHETRASLVSKLHDDILFYIFRWNSNAPNLGQGYYLGNIPSFERCFRNPPSTSPLLTNRRTSQVCRQWRKIMVHSASIWANAIELEYLDQNGDDWRKEVLIRAGEAPLTVIGQIGHGHNLRTIPFVLDILESHWKQIKTLIIMSESADIDEKLLNVLSRPAPNLMQFIVILRNRQDDRFSNNIIINAPNLHTLRTVRLLFNLSEPSWSSKMRYLELEYYDYGGKPISITELLHGLECMTSLEVLRISGIKPGSDMDSTVIPTIKLLALRSFKIRESDSAIPDLLSHIIIPPQCSFHGSSMVEGFDNEEISEHIALGYAAFFKNNFAHPTMSHMTYSLKYESIDDIAEDPDYMYFFKISFGSRSTESGCLESRFLYTATFDSSRTAFCMAKALRLSCELSNVTTLSFYLKVERSEIELELEPLFDSMYDFLLSFQSTKILHTDEDTLKLYMGSERLCATDILLPRLDTVYTDLWDEGVKEFLDYRDSNAGPAEGSDAKCIKRLVFSEDSPVLQDNSTDIGMAARMGLSFGVEGYEH